MDTKQVIANMLKENTGRHMLDSGGAYGRHWERNAHRDFESETPATVSFDYGYTDLTYNLYHWLVERLEYDMEVDNIFREWATNDENNEKSWYQCMNEFMDYLGDDGAEVSGLYGEGEPMSINTYNGDSLLSQVIQYTYFTIEDSNVLNDGIYILLQIHGGADVRGGYCSPRMFIPSGYMEEGIFCNSDGTIFCPECGANWWTDDAYHFYADGCSWPKSGQLNEHIVVDVSDVYYPVIADRVAHAHAVLNEMVSDGITRTLVVSGDEAYCPVCAKAKLAA